MNIGEIFSIERYGSGVSDWRLKLRNVFTKDSAPKVAKNIMTHDPPMSAIESATRVSSGFLVQRRPTIDAMPEPDDENFHEKVDKHFRSEIRTQLARDPEKESFDLFYELQKLLNGREEAIEAHQKYMRARKDVERHTGTTTDAKPLHLPALDHLAQDIKDTCEKVKVLLTAPTRPVERKSKTNDGFVSRSLSPPKAADFGKPTTIADINAANAKFWASNK